MLLKGYHFWLQYKNLAFFQCQKNIMQRFPIFTLISLVIMDFKLLTSLSIALLEFVLIFCCEKNATMPNLLALRTSKSFDTLAFHRLWTFFLCQKQLAFKKCINWLIYSINVKKKDSRATVTDVHSFKSIITREIEINIGKLLHPVFWHWKNAKSLYCNQKWQLFKSIYELCL